MTDTDIATILNAIGDLRSDFTAMKTDVYEKFDTVQKEIVVMKTDMAGIKTDIGSMKTQMEAVNTDIHNIVKQHEADMDYIKNCLDGLNGQVHQQ